MTSVFVSGINHIEHVGWLQFLSHSDRMIAAQFLTSHSLSRKNGDWVQPQVVQRTTWTIYCLKSSYSCIFHLILTQ